jgi:hypothetical protein
MADDIKPEDTIPSLGFLDEIETSPVKALLLGDSGLGKTGAMASLVCAGYKLYILDFDMGTPILRNALGSSRSPYAQYCKAKNINVNDHVFSLQLTEKMKVMGGKPTPVSAQVWTKAGNALENFKVGDRKLGNIGEWGQDVILVIDSFTTLGFAALWNVQAMNNRLGADFSGYDWQRDVGQAQNMMERLLQLLYSKAVGCNVLVISHITFVDDSKGVATAPSRDPDAPNIQVRGYPSAIGRSLSQRVGRYFNDSFQLEMVGHGPTARRYIYTLPPSNVLVKSSAPFTLKPKYTIETGLAEIFAGLRGQPEPEDLIRTSEREVWYKATRQKD